MFSTKNFALQPAVDHLISALKAHGHPHWKGEGDERALERTLKTEQVPLPCFGFIMADDDPPAFGKACGRSF